jgi:hypothetical protein
LPPLSHVPRLGGKRQTGLFWGLILDFLGI